MRVLLVHMPGPVNYTTMLVNYTADFHIDLPMEESYFNEFRENYENNLNNDRVLVIF